MFAAVKMNEFGLEEISGEAFKPQRSNVRLSDLERQLG